MKTIQLDIDDKAYERICSSAKIRHMVEGGSASVTDDFIKLIIKAIENKDKSVLISLV